MSCVYTGEEEEERGGRIGARSVPRPLFSLSPSLSKLDWGGGGIAAGRRKRHIRTEVSQVDRDKNTSIPVADAAAVLSIASVCVTLFPLLLPA